MQLPARGDRIDAAPLERHDRARRAHTNRSHVGELRQNGIGNPDADVRASPPRSSIGRSGRTASDALRRTRRRNGPHGASRRRATAAASAAAASAASNPDRSYAMIRTASRREPPTLRRLRSTRCAIGARAGWRPSRATARRDSWRDNGRRAARATLARPGPAMTGGAALAEDPRPSSRLACRPRMPCARHHLEQDHAKRKDVGASVGLPPSICSGAMYCTVPIIVPSGGQVRRAHLVTSTFVHRPRRRLRQAEVQELGLSTPPRPRARGPERCCPASDRDGRCRRGARIERRGDLLRVS